MDCLTEGLGKHMVTEGQINVQLGEESAQAKGNLFRDHFLNLQQRALLEPRLLIEYEERAWKRFDKVYNT
ncbi:hypothetical protein VNI00_013874 [Paramarasmius palmivorus]|uniref:Uncharacterized protein n=1 Tax=Paramarasmius palmivorus TaxID=297713 RepID=A0AAW0BVE0_9AGAR